MKEIYLLTQKYPKEELYGLTSQMRRASISIPANIAEGWSRKIKDYMRFIQIAKGSLLELETYLVISQKLNYITEAEEKRLTEDCHGIGRMTTALLKSLQEKYSKGIGNWE